jgi:hypothetical protein
MVGRLNSRLVGFVITIGILLASSKDLSSDNSSSSRGFFVDNTGSPGNQLLC